MDLGEKDIKKISILLLFAVLIILCFIIIRPFLTSIIGGLLLAYVFSPIYRRFNFYINNKNISASLITILILAIAFSVLWFTAPLLIKQLFELLITVQKVDMQAVVKSLFPSASEAFISQMTITLQNIISSAF